MMSIANRMTILRINMDITRPHHKLSIPDRLFVVADTAYPKILEELKLFAEVGGEGRPGGGGEGARTVIPLLHDLVSS